MELAIGMGQLKGLNLGISWIGQPASSPALHRQSKLCSIIPASSLNAATSKGQVQLSCSHSSRDSSPISIPPESALCWLAEVQDQLSRELQPIRVRASSAQPLEINMAPAEKLCTLMAVGRLHKYMGNDENQASCWWNHRERERLPCVLCFGCECPQQDPVSESLILLVSLFWEIAGVLCQEARLMDICY